MQALTSTVGESYKSTPSGLSVVNASKLLAGLAALLVVAALVGAAVSLATALGDAETAATAVLVAAAVLAVVGAGARRGGSPNGRTPYW